MSALIIDYKELENIAKHADSLVKKAADYTESLTKKVANKIGSVDGGQNDFLTNASYYVNAKISELQTKAEAYTNFAKGVYSLIENAKEADKDVARTITANQNSFLKNNAHLKIDDKKASLISFLVDLKNSIPIVEFFCDAISFVGDTLSSWADNIKYWYKCEGGKEIFDLIWAISGAVVAVLLFIVTIPASTFVAICAAIAAGITALNALVNVGTSIAALVMVKNEDPAWAQIYSNRNTMQDLTRQINWGNGYLNKMSYIFADIVDVAELFCGVVAIVDTVKKVKIFKRKNNFIRNYFDKNIGLLSYFKELKYTKDGVPIVKNNIAETRYTARSIWRGIKAFACNSTIDKNSTEGIRTILNKNFVLDWKDFKNSFSRKSVGDLFKYRITNGSKLNTIMFSSNSDLVKFAKSKWELKDTKDILVRLSNAIKVSEKITNGTYTFTDIEKAVMKKVYNYNDITSVLYKLGVFKALDDELEWNTSQDGLAQKIFKSFTKSYPVVKKYGILE